MKVLAEYVMAGPRQASIFCLGFGLVPIIGPWLSSAAIALIILQLGLTQAIKILPWALLPGIVWAALGDPSYLILLTSVFLSALVMEMYRSLGLALLAGVSVSALGFLIMISLLPNKLEQLTAVMNEMFAASPEMEQIFFTQGDGEKFEKSGKIEAAEEASQLGPDKKVINREELNQTIELLTKMAFAWASSMSACLVLLVGRWWQSLLYKLGAFQTEFHALRLSWNQVLAVFVIIVFLMQGLNSLSDDNLGMVIAPLFTIPILFSGIALVHGLIAIAGMSIHWLGMFYVALLFVGHLVYLPLLVAALLDVAFDFRSRFRRKNSSE